MLSANVKEFVSANHQAVLTTFRDSGAAQMSIVTVGRMGTEWGLRPLRTARSFTTLYATRDVRYWCPRVTGGGM